MSVTRKPKDPPTKGQPAKDKAEFQAYLNRGGSVASEKQPSSKPVRFTLSIPGSLCQELDQLREAFPLKTSRHQWVLEAIVEKLAREAS